MPFGNIAAGLPYVLAGGGQPPCVVSQERNRRRRRAGKGPWWRVSERANPPGESPRLAIAGGSCPGPGGIGPAQAYRGGSRKPLRTSAGPFGRSRHSRRTALLCAGGPGPPGGACGKPREEIRATILVSGKPTGIPPSSLTWIADSSNPASPAWFVQSAALSFSSLSSVRAARSAPPVEPSGQRFSPSCSKARFLRTSCELLGELAQLAFETVREMMAAAVDESHARRGMVAVIEPFAFQKYLKPRQPRISSPSHAEPRSASEYFWALRAACRALDDEKTKSTDLTDRHLYRRR